MLKDIKIIDFTNYIPGPFATLRLAEFGAEVIKVEAPEGDPARNSGDGYVFNAHNRGKKSIVIDLKQQEGKSLALDLLAEADVVVESFRPGVMEKLGLGYEAVKKRNPGIIYCSVTGYGSDGEMSRLGSHDLNYMSLSGSLAQLKDSAGRPIHPTHTFSDYIGGLAASERILAALVARGRSGEGSNHCISIADSMASLMANHVLIEKETGYEHGVSVLNGTIISYGIYETKDGRYVSLGALEPKFWNNFCQAVGRPDWQLAHDSRPEESNPVFTELVQLFKSKSLSEWSEFGRKIDCCLTPVLETAELKDDPYWRERSFILPEGQIKMHGDLTARKSTPPPEKGEQSEAIIKERKQRK
ncbi:CaiB/BaiF CoA transferase family protein [Mesobacillus stamsii]|uniref:Crotonobetainyl-CoA:carnitine CoA-transferase CaiB-like acyl-CoA transferase n=1 Tax=Mesobacillus stamsii TaxID=225347 RepID=A0ABU0FVW9_9BACI|nr:CoA transferase [Mesobacillus stamsii]MDQ0413970.1 crotonobetainyl-CoA:carnitine CoA-transferase CaiB-like acyl-CoA transferase [Mesobacillus stamsii]